MARARDFQKSRVYSLDFAIRKHPSFGVDAEDAIMPSCLINHVIKKTCEDFEITPPTLKLNSRKKNWAHYHPADHMIQLPAQEGSWAHHIIVLLHETAHAIHKVLGHYRFADGYNSTPKGSSHGHHFMAIFFYCIIKHTDITEQELQYMARKHGVRVGKLIDLVPKAGWINNERAAAARKHNINEED